jgi:hypothetical protein
MAPFDLTLLLLLSDSVQNAMTGPDTWLLGGQPAPDLKLPGRRCFGRQPALPAFDRGRTFSADS